MPLSGLYRFTLYVAGDAQNSLCAIANLTALCQAQLPGSHEVEVVDVFKEPERALADGVFLTPTLVKLEPGPHVQIVGTLAETRVVVQALGLESAAA